MDSESPSKWIYSQLSKQSKDSVAANQTQAGEAQEHQTSSGCWVHASLKVEEPLLKSAADLLLDDC